MPNPERPVESARGAEKRHHPRVELRTSVRVAYPDRESLRSSFSRNISVGGMFVESSTPPPPGTVVRFEIDLVYFREAVRGLGEVVWIAHGEDGTPAGFGIRFDEIDPRQRQLIFRIVDRFVQGGGEPFDLER